MNSISALSGKSLKDFFSRRVSTGNNTLCRGKQIPTGWADLS